MHVQYRDGLGMVCVTGVAQGTNGVVEARKSPGQNCLGPLAVGCVEEAVDEDVSCTV